MAWYCVLSVIVLTLVYVCFNFFRIKRMDEGTAEMVEMAGIIRSGASTFLKTDQTLQQVIFNVFTDTDFNLYKQLLTHTPPTVTHR